MHISPPVWRSHNHLVVSTMPERLGSSPVSRWLDRLSLRATLQLADEFRPEWRKHMSSRIVLLRTRATACVGTLFLLAACSSSVAPVGTLPACDTRNGDITLPSDFCAVVVADKVGMARHIAVGATGDIYVAIDDSTKANGILALRDTDGDGRANTQQYFGAPLADGIGILGDFLYVGYRTQIVRYRLVPGGLVPTGTAEIVVSGLPSSGDHFRKNFTFDGSNAMFVNIGSATNSCQVTNRATQSPGIDPCPELATRAGIWQFNTTTLGQTQSSGVRIATGFRNTEALRYDAARRALFGVPHGRDELSEDFPQFFTRQEQADLPAEEFHRINQGDDAGWPYCFYDGIRNIKVLAPEYGGDGDVVGARCATKKQPLLDFPAHWSPNDLLFYQGTQFPARYRGGAFIAFHGGKDRAPLPEEGYHLVFVPFTGDVPSQTWEVFADGFTGGGSPLPANAAHRPMGLAEGADGSLYLTDDKGGRIWRIIHRPR